MKKALFFLLITLVVVLVLALNIRPEPAALTKYLYQPKVSPTATDLTVQFLGNTNLLFSDGKTNILTDGFFSRPSAYQVLMTAIAPNSKEVKECLKTAGITQLDAVIPVHSHFDHAMDAALVADLTHARLIGSSSTINIGKGYGLKEEQMMIPIPYDTVEIGAFKLIFIPSRHWQYPDAEQRKILLDQAIEKPLVPPASIYDYKEGISYTILIQHGTTKMMVQGSAGYKKDVIPAFDADLLFVSIAGLETMNQEYNEDYQKHVIDVVQPETLIPIHWDDFTLPLSEGLKTTHVLFNWKYGSDLGKAFEIVEKNNLQKGRVIQVLPLWKKVSISNGKLN